MMVRLVLFLFLLFALPVEAKEFVLNDTCPPSFEKVDDGTCRLITLYEFYQSVEQHGGVQANLPPLKNRYTPQQIDLGRFLFFDPILSANKDMSCASCHQPDKGFADGRKRSMGARTDTRAGKGRMELDRSAPSLWNVAFLDLFMWDGRASSLEEQAHLPLFSEKEMALTPEELEDRLLSSDTYVALFAEAFDRKPDVDAIATALSAFQSSLVSFNSRYDRYAHGDQDALSEEEIKGYNAFRGFVARCSQCHIPPLFTDSQLAVVGAPANDKGHVDEGAGPFFEDPAMRGAFRVPTLRNVTKTAPFFHSGQFDTLAQVVDFYNETRGHMAPKEQDLKIHWHVHMTKGPELSTQDRDDIVAFLHALEDETMKPETPGKVPSGLPVTLSIKE